MLTVIKNRIAGAAIKNPTNAVLVMFATVVCVMPFGLVGMVSLLGGI